MFFEYELEDERVIRFEVSKNPFGDFKYFQENVKVQQKEKFQTYNEDYDIKRVYEDKEKGFYFYCNGQIIYIQNFKHLSLDDLIEKFRRNENVDSDEILKTIWAEKSEIGIFAKCRANYQVLKSGFIYKRFPENMKVSILIEPFAAKTFQQFFWKDVIRLEPIVKPYCRLVHSEKHIFSKFVLMLKSGEYKLVNRQEYDPFKIEMI